MSDECPECRTVAILGSDDCELIITALGIYSSDYNDAPHEDVVALIERLSPAPAHQDSARPMSGEPST